MKPWTRAASGLLPALAACVWQGCWPDISSPSPKPPDGMASVSSGNRSTVLGSEDAYAKKDEETPRLTAAFGYDFFIDKTEVTQADYESRMGRNPAKAELGLGVNLPVYNVTWYDALLYCNARSKSQGMDTVYAYSERQQDAGGRTFFLAGLQIRYEVRGYRLPTEAEWEFAARGGVSSAFPWGEAPDSAAATKVAWHTANAEGKVHPVRQLKANGYGLHDMLGNVMEWVNDWKAPYAPVTVRNFLGSREPGLIAERGVKGGAFNYDFRYLRFSGRSANYPTLGSAATEYIGFRCVLGPVSGGRYLAGGEAYLATPAVIPEPSAAKKLFGHNRVKLVFVNATSSTRTLAYIDFSESPVIVHEFLDDSTVFTPVISPDGQWVAYSNVEEGGTGTGTVKIRRLAPGAVAQALPASSAVIPRWWVHPASSDTFLVYATSARDNTEPAWASDQTFRQRIAGGAAVGSPVLVSAGGYHDGYSSDGKYLATGYRRLRFRNAAAGERILFTGPLNGKPAGDTSQVCNVSLHPDFAAFPQMLLLDFGHSAAGSVVGRPYGLHEILFRIDSAGNVTRWYEAPTGFTAWQDVEWSNHPDYAVGVGEDASRGYPAVVGTYLKNSLTAVLARGSTLREPGLWIRPGAPLSSGEGVADSMGQYDTPLRGADQSEYAVKMRLLWLKRDSAEVVFLGSSHVKSGIAPERFTHFQSLNLGYSGAGLQGAGEMLIHYVLPHYPRLRAVLFEVVPGWYFDYEGDFTWGSNMKESRGYAYDRAHDFWPTSVPPAIDSVMLEKTFNLQQFFDGRGGNFNATGNWGAVPPPVYKRGSGVLPAPFVEENLEKLRHLALSADSQGILFVMALFPQSPGYKSTSYYGKSGPTWEAGRSIVASMKQICSQIARCRFYDANLEGDHDYDSTMAVNEDHLSTAGALVLSRRLDSALVRWLAPSP
jgi:uncharacterized protein (TIGR02171 family)